jgi:predicted  nucleic acid-binding Zn-ribbon protein
MNELLQNLLRLQTLEFEKSAGKAPNPAVAEVRAKIPAQILGHYDRLVARGKKGLAAVRDQVCTGCHMRLPIGVVTTLMHGNDIQLCDTCGRYLYLAEPTKPADAPPAAAKPARKPRKSKRSTQLV